LSVMNWFAISDAGFFTHFIQRFHFSRSKSLYFLASSVVRVLLHCYSFYIFTVLLRLPNIYFLLYSTIIYL
jgi:hypothetical protein